MRIAVLTVALLVGLTGTAQAKLRWPIPHVLVVMASCPAISDSQVGGCYDGGTLYIDPSRPDPTFTLWHERGHAIDAQRLSAGERHRFRRLLVEVGAAHIAFATGGWLLRQAGEAPVASPGEFFADAYANCSMHHRPVNGTWSAAYGYMPRNNKATTKVCRFIRRAGQSL